MKKAIVQVETFLKSKILLWGMVVFASLAFGVLCFGKTIWLDEALTGTYIRMGWRDLIEFTATDVHPPLYYLIVKLGIVLFGDKICVVKFFSYLPFIFTLILTATKVRKNYGEKTAFVLIALFCTTPCIIDKNVEMRMYQWALFFVYAFSIYLFEALKCRKVKNWYICLFYGVCAAYTHYYALIAVIILYAIVFFVYIKEKKIIFSIVRNAVVSVLLYLPWLIVFFNQAKKVKEEGWWQEAAISLKDVYDYIVWPFYDNTGYERVLFFILLIFILLFLGKNTALHRVERFCSMAAYLLFIALGLIVIKFYQPVFIPRFIYPTVGVLLLGLALSIAQWRTEVICGVCAIILFFGMKTYNSQLHYQFNEDSISSLMTFMDNMAKDETVFICDQDAVKCVVEYLYPDYYIENMEDIENTLPEEKMVFYFISDPNNIEENMSELFVRQKLEFVDHIYLQYHSFDIYSAGNTE